MSLLKPLVEPGAARAKVYPVMPTQSRLEADMAADTTANIAREYVLPAGTLTITSDLTIPDLATLRGQSYDRYGTVLDLDADVSVSCGKYGGIHNLRINIDNASTVSGLIIDKVGEDYDGVVGALPVGAAVDRVAVTGGSDATAYAVQLVNFFRIDIGQLLIQTGMNGILIADTDGEFKYGNGQVKNLEVNLTQAGRVGIDFDGTNNSTKFVNLLDFGYIACVTGLGTGSTGLRIRNCPWMSFGLLDLEGCDTSLTAEGGVNSGSAARGLHLGSIFADGDVTLGAASGGHISSGRVAGTLTDSSSGGWTFGRLLDGSNEPRLYQQTALLLGPRADATRTIKAVYKNQTGSTIAKGTVVRPHGSIQNAVTTLVVGSTGQDWIAVAAEDVPALTEGEFYLLGEAEVLANGAIANQEYVTVDTTSGTLGQGVSNGTTYPTTGTLVGRCVYGAADGGLARVVLSHA